MKIGIDARMWNETGIGRYIRNIVYNIANLDTTNEYVIFLLTENIDQIQLPDNFKKVKADIKWNSFAEQIILPYIFYTENLDLLFYPNFNISIFYLKPIVVSIHDLTVLKFKTGRATTLPYPMYLLKRLAAHIAFNVAVVRARAIFTVSNFVKADLLLKFKVDPNKVYVVGCGVEDTFQPIPFGDQLPILQKYGISKPYLFYVGNAHPHKNLERLLFAFEKVSEKFPDLTLVLGGSKKFFYERLETEWSHKPIFQRLRFVGYISDSDLPALYSGSVAFVNPSLYEGFGLQLLEAFSCNTRVICSNVSSLPEVGGKAPYYFNPVDVNNIAQIIEECLHDTNIGNRIEEGMNQASKYSWKSSSNKLLSLLLKYGK